MRTKKMVRPVLVTRVTRVTLVTLVTLVCAAAAMLGACVAEDPGVDPADVIWDSDAQRCYVEARAVAPSGLAGASGEAECSALRTAAEEGVIDGDTPQGTPCCWELCGQPRCGADLCKICIQYQEE